jgi:hypothetical protein
MSLKEPTPQESTFLVAQIKESALLSDMKSIENNLVRLYYFLGLFSLKTNPSRTEQFWILARDENPGWSYLHIELASLEEHIFHNPTKAKEYLKVCQQNTSAKKHCNQILSLSIPMPGTFQKNILAIPQQ